MNFRYALVLVSICWATSAAAEIQEGMWRAWLQSPGGEIPFGLEIQKSADGWGGAILNGDERIEIPSLRLEDGAWLIDFPHYDSKIRASLGENGQSLSGEWHMVRRDHDTRMPFEARFGDQERFDAPEQFERADWSAAGRWLVNFESDDQDSVGMFEQGEGSALSGTFLNVTGDYRYLAGRQDGKQLSLSCFDGAHAFLFHATQQSADSLSGEFWSRDTWHETWTATRDPQAVLPDAFGVTSLDESIELGSLSFPDLTGQMRALDDDAFAGSCRILYVFGSWCPNCADATEYLVELQERYGRRGLSVLGLAFEHSGDFERDSRQVRRYMKRHGVDYPVLVAGLSDKAEASKALPLLDRVRSYPTTIFLDADSRVRAIHTGFTGPATGAAHIRLKARFQAIIEELLGEAAGR